MSGLLAIFAANANGFKDLEGVDRSLAEYRGSWVVVNYWATWCAPCIEEIPALNAFHRANQDKAVVIGINNEGLSRSLLKIFMQEQSVAYPVWTLSPEKEPWPGPVNGIPTTFLISPQGEVVARQVGRVTRGMIERFIQLPGR